MFGSLPIILVVGALLSANDALFANGPLPGPGIRAAAAGPPPVKGTLEESVALAGQLRTLILQFLPDPLYEDDKKWNQQKKNARGKMKNDGRWMKVRITSQNLPDSLALTVDNMVKENSRKTFTVNLALPALVQLDRQT